MSRLIDADDLIEEINKKMPQGSAMGVFKAFIDEQPTAYNVEKVVAELEEFTKLAEDRWVNGTSNHAYQEHKCWVKAIDIVKSGGIDGKI